MAIDSGDFTAALKAFQQAIGYDAIATQHAGNWGAAPAQLLSAVRKQRASAIRGEKHVRPIYDYCARELAARRFRKSHLFPREGAPNRARTKVHGGFFEKEVDAGLSIEHTGPLLVVSVKAMLTASRNLKNRIEEAIADATNLHTRYPMLCFGLLFLVPERMETERRAGGAPKVWIDEPLIGPGGAATRLADTFLRYSAQLQPRVDITETPARYEAVALALADIDHDPPVLNATFPPQDSPLRIERFFDVLHQRFLDRNRFISEAFEP